MNYFNYPVTRKSTSTPSVSAEAMSAAHNINTLNETILTTLPQHVVVTKKNTGTTILYYPNPVAEVNILFERVVESKQAPTKNEKGEKRGGTEATACHERESVKKGKGRDVRACV